ncbi:NAD-dependent DNA ligase LigA [Crateriforma spongiae]|uniref:NAD-dependent DNA ligase LigA n=1 Tax=Crateriforma spongiae TaxID=2724528 RepID=UPI0014449F69|nr:NAD-dependent DNA ligase LigA [Crateriforma spongiae]
MTDKSVAEEVQSLRQQIRHHDRLYYVDATPEISDLQYDRLLKRLQQLEQDHPDLRDPDSPTMRVGDQPVAHLDQVAHRVPMLSIDNTYSRDELQAYFERTEKSLDGQPVRWVMEYKIDGVAASVRYEAGRMMLALTRGNGEVGDDITHNIRTVRDLPLILHDNGSVPDVLEIRGEVYMTNADLADLNVRQAERGEPLYKNTRNVTAGTIRLLDPAIAAQRNLRFFAHGIGEVSGMDADNHMEFLKRLGDFGIPPTPDVMVFDHWSEAMKAVAALEDEMPDLPFEVDGIVFKVDDFASREKLGIRSKSPRWLVAYKFERYEATTRLNQITVQVGKTGTVTPVAHLDPVEIAETTVSRASLHNADEIERLDVREGDVVVVEKAGKIIPKVVRVEKHLRTDDLKPYVFPKQCPECDTELVRDEGGVYIRCPNPACPAQLRQKLIYFGSRTGMDIDGLGDELVDVLLDRGLVKTYGDLYRLTADQVAELNWIRLRKGRDRKEIEVQVGQKNADSLIQGIDASRDRGLARVLASLSIRHVGPSVARIITGKYHTLDLLRDASQEDLADIHEIGDRIAGSLHEFIHSDGGRQTLDDLAAAGVKMTDPEPVPDDDEQRWLSGKTLVVTGTLKHFKRDEIKKAITELGGRASGSVSKNTDFLVAGEKAGSKLDKAKQLGVRVVDEDEFRAWLADNRIHDA